MPCAAPVTIATAPPSRAIGISSKDSPGLGKSHAAFAADEEEVAPLEKFACDEGKRLRPLGGDRAAGVVDEHEVAIGQRRAIAIGGVGPVLRSAKEEYRQLDVAAVVGRAGGRDEND